MLSYTGSDSSSCVPQVRAVLQAELAGGACLFISQQYFLDFKVPIFECRG